jgi:hypothetical protein
MNAVDVIRYEAHRAYAWLENIVGDVDAGLANWQPPGTANSIAGSYAHIMIWTDVDVTRHFYGRAPLLAGSWGEQLGRSESAPDEFATDRQFDWATLRAYGRAVEQEFLRTVEALTLDDLAREFQMMPAELGTWKGIDVFLLHGSSHVYMHGGEIACIKGIRGLEGYRPFKSLWP